MSRSVPAAFALLAALALPTSAGAESRADRDALRLDRAAFDLLNDASRQVRRERPSCRFRPPQERRGDVPVNDADPSPAFTNVLGIFRRPPTDAEVAAATEADRFFMGAGLLERPRRGTRIVRSPSGAQFTITAYNRVRRVGPDAATIEACQEAIERAVGRSSAKPSVRRRAQRVLTRVRRDEARALAAQPAVFEAIDMNVREPGERGSGGTGGRFDAGEFARRGLFLSSGGGPRGRRSSVLSGLVPDGVASITLEFPRFESRGPHRDRVDYGRPATRTAEVRDNVVSVEVPRPPEDAFAPRVVWRGPGGELVRVVRPPR